MDSLYGLLHSPDYRSRYAEKMVSASRESLVGWHFQLNFHGVLVGQPAMT